MDPLESRDASAGPDEPDTFRLSQAVGWASVGFGLAKLLAPGAVKAVQGGSSTPLIRAAGLADIALGMGILLSPRRTGPMWSRVAGDVLSLALRVWSVQHAQTSSQRAVASIIGSATVFALDALASRQVTRAEESAAPPESSPS